MIDQLLADIRKAKHNDPAAQGTVAIALTYAGLHALWAHRLAHYCWTNGWGLTARVIAHFSRFLTGIEIHPGAAIGDHLFIDHGMGTVIGETAIVGDNVLMYHGVTLGGKSSKREKRHPTICDEVTLGASSTLIGDITVGYGATVGAGAVVVDDVPPGTTVVGVPAEPVDAPEEITLEASPSESITCEGRRA